MSVCFSSYLINLIELETRNLNRMVEEKTILLDIMYFFKANLVKMNKMKLFTNFKVVFYPLTKSVVMEQYSRCGCNFFCKILETTSMKIVIGVMILLMQFCNLEAEIDTFNGDELFQPLLGLHDCARYIDKFLRIHSFNNVQQNDK